MQWDAFLSHASEDKDEVAGPLYQELVRLDLEIWFDKFTLQVGDSLRRSIDQGLAGSRFGIVVISPNFLNKEWPKRELDGLAAREVGGQKVILPVWHQIDREQISQYSPTLADRFGLRSSAGVGEVAKQLESAIRAPATIRTPAKTHAAAGDAIVVAPSGAVRTKTIYCTNCGATPGERSDCTPGRPHNFVNSSAAKIYCTHCGAIPGKRSDCMPGRIHNFISSSAALVYCANCGAAPGKRSDCIPGRAHNFVASSAGKTYCTNCGAAPGERSDCVLGQVHNFVASSAGKTYCTNCGAMPGTRSDCYTGRTHNFVNSRASTIYCTNCGATPGKKSDCSPGRLHNFVAS